MAPRSILDNCPQELRDSVVFARVPLDSHGGNVWTYSLVVLVRAIRYLIVAPPAQVSVAASHVTADVAMCFIHRVLYRSRPVIFVHHLIATAGRRRSFRVSAARIIEAVSLILARRSSAIVFTGDPAAYSELLRRGFSESAIFLTGNAYDPLVALPPRSYVQEHPLIVFCGRLCEEKGIWDVISVARGLRDAVPSARIEMLGEGLLHNALVARIAAEGLINVSVRGWVSEAEKWTVLRRASLTLAPSYEEGWGIAVGEALFAGTPVVAYDLSAYSHFGATLIKVPKGDVSRLTSTVIELLLKSELLGRATASVEQAELPLWEKILEREASVIEDSYFSRGTL
ncbi:glycosyltransferase family 4 protein [Ferrimicrobium acidiphilum]|nr:glycosyltransferase family 4 protein [Ferrimicrobium acidiphilum]